MLVEQHFAPMNRYANSSDTATSIDDVEWFAKNKGITNLDDLSVKVRTIIDDVNESELARHKAKKAREAKARSEYIDALMNLEDGTAALRQTKKVTVIQSAKTMHESDVSKPRIGSKRSEYKAARERRESLVAKLKAGEFIEVLRQGKGKDRKHEYYIQYGDIVHIRRKLGLKVARVYCGQRRQSFYAIDAFPRHTPTVTISGMTSSKKELLQALLSRELVLASDMTCPTKMASRTVTAIMNQYDLDIYTVFDSSTTEGWIFIPDEEKRKAKLKEVGDMLQALDFLEERKLRKENDRLPMHVPDVILDAAYREFKRVAKDAGATINEVLAVKDGQ